MVNQEQVKQYVNGLNPKIFGFNRLESVEIKQLPQGLWNFNYLITINGEKFVFKIYSGDIHGLVLFGNKGKDEATALQILENIGIAPKQVHFEHSKLLDKEVLIYQFANGLQLSEFSPKIVKELAKLLAQLHAFEVDKISSLPRKTETVQTLLQDTLSLLDLCKKSSTSEEEIKLFEKFVEKAKAYVQQQKEIKHPFSLVHSDLAPCNIIVDDDKITFIDWQSPKITDPAFDVWAFLSEPFIRWDLSESLTSEQKKIFVDTYLSSVNDSTLMKRIEQKAPLWYLNIALYCHARYSDYKSGKLSSERTKGREHHLEKYNVLKKVCLDKLNEWVVV